MTGLVRSQGHRSVMVLEVVEQLSCQPGGRWIDGTVGGGGHAGALLSASSPDGRLLGLDRDHSQIERARDALRRWDGRATLVHARFSAMDVIAEREGMSGADGIVLDLGWSSDQMMDASRGFSVRQEGPLDMRLDAQQAVTAADVVNQYEERELARIFREWGDEPFADRIAQAIVTTRRQEPFQTTTQLSRVVAHATPARARHGRRHVATKVFQALRMAVNQEVEELRDGLSAAWRTLRVGGRLAVISFHSGEDRMVKRAFEEGAREGWLKILTKKPIQASPVESRNNPRARSAKLRVAELVRASS